MLLMAAPSIPAIIPPVCSRRCSFRVVLNIHTHRISRSQQPVPNRAYVYRFRICFTEQAFWYEWRTECIHNLCLARCLGAWCDVPATTGDCRGYMGGPEKNGIFW
jgi:hypothetical protein